MIRGREAVLDLSREDFQAVKRASNGRNIFVSFLSICEAQSLLWLVPAVEVDKLPAEQIQDTNLCLGGFGDDGKGTANVLEVSGAKQPNRDILPIPYQNPPS
jgi:hypothetical protein